MPSRAHSPRALLTHAHCAIRWRSTSLANGFVAQDFDLMVNYWGSAYVMVDSVGIMPNPYHPRGGGPQGMSKFMLGEWRHRIDARAAAGQSPVILHSCHVACSGNYFSGPTLALAACNGTAPNQLFELSADGDAPGFMRDGDRGLCVGCADALNIPCANTAAHNASGLGYGMQACLAGPTAGSEAGSQLFNFSTKTGKITGPGGSCLGLAQDGAGPQVVSLPSKQCSGTGNAAAQSRQWTRGPPVTTSGGIRTLLRSVAKPGRCLAAGPTARVDPDPWCRETSNMYRSNTDIWAGWIMIMVQLESLVGMGAVSRPGSWAFADCLEAGVPGVGSLTWEETKSHVALWVRGLSPPFVAVSVATGSVMPQHTTPPAPCVHPDKQPPRVPHRRFDLPSACV